MAVDTSTYPTAASMAAQQQANNPLTMLSSLAELRGRTQQNQLVARTMAAKQAAGQAVQAATGSDGVIDTNAAGLAIAHNPDAALTAPEALADLQAQRQAQVAEHTARVDLALKQNGFMTNSLGALADKPGVTSKDVASLAGTLVANGILDPKMAATELSAMPADETQIPAYLRTLQLRSQQAAQQILDYHQMGLANLGATQETVNTAPLAAPTTLTNTLSPGEAASPVTGPVSPTGAPTTTPLGQRAGMGTIATGMAPAAQAAATTAGSGTAQQALAFEQAARGTVDMHAALANMSGDLSKMPSSGPGSEGRNRAMSAINGFMGQFGPFDAEKVAAQEGFGKMAAQVVARQRQQMGLSGTDQQLSMIEHASPGSQLSKLGNEGQISVIKGNNDALQAEAQAWERYKQSGKGSETFNQFTTTWNKHVDPLAFQYQYMSQEQKKALVGAMSAAEKDKFAQSLSFARHNGLVK
jgi:hypothetical protein